MAFRLRTDDEMAFRWRADDSPTLNAGLVAVIFRRSGPELLRNSIIIVIFRGGGGVRTPFPPSGSAHGLLHKEQYERGLNYLLRLICR